MMNATLDLENVIQAVWTTAVGVDFTILPADRRPANGDELRTGLIQVTGGWNGVVLVTTTSPLVNALARAMLGNAQTTPDLVVDLFGELTNMIAGNIKANLPGPSSLGLPAVVLGAEHAVHIRDASPIATLALECLGEPCCIQVLTVRPPDRLPRPSC